MTVEENLSFFATVFNTTIQENYHLIEEIYSQIEPFKKRKAGKLSGGWQRRLSLAMALIGEPEILFLDEPTLGLDVLARSELWDVIRALKGRTTIVLTTHYMEEAESLSDRIGVMKKGHLLFTGNGEEMKKATGKEKFEDAFVAMVKEERR